MIKRYYSSLIALKYSYAMTGLSLVIFALALMYTRTRSVALRLTVFAAAGVLLAVMVLYYRERFIVSRQVKKITAVEEYEQAAAFGRTFLLENRMLTYVRGRLLESDYSDLSELSCAPAKNGMQKITLKFADTAVQLPVNTVAQAGRLAAFLKQKNPALLLSNLEAAGPGTFASIKTNL